VVYQLSLPIAWKIHNVFHASLLSPYSETPAHSPNFSQPPPNIINNEEQYEVELIRNHRYDGINKKLQYLIRWKGYSAADDTWESAADIHTPDLVKSYHRVYGSLKHIKANQLLLRTLISFHPRAPYILGRNTLDSSSHSSMTSLALLSHPLSPIQDPQVSQVQTLLLHPRYL